MRSISGDDSMGHGSCHIREAEVAACEAIGESLVIEPHQVKNGRVQIVDVHPILNSMVAEFVRGAVDKAGLDAPSRHPHRVAIRIVIAPIDTLRPRSAPEFSTPDN